MPEIRKETDRLGVDVPACVRFSERRNAQCGLKPNWEGSK